MPVSILDIALKEGAKAGEDGSINMGEFEALGLPFFAGCQHCGASLGPYNAYPSKSGFIQCKECIDEIGFETVEQFHKWCEDNSSVEEL